MQIVWVVDDDLSPYAGHGIDFFADPGRSAESLVAVLRGFDWLHFEPETVEVRIRAEDSEFSADALAGARAAIERFVRARGPMAGDPAKIASDLYAWVNG
jgi:hypothetical protein